MDILNLFSAAFDLKYVIQHYKNLLLCIQISGIHSSGLKKSRRSDSSIFINKTKK